MAAQISIAVAVLVRDGRVLLAHRHPARRAYPNCWALVGGHVESGESRLEAVGRECLEELDIHVLDPSPIPMAVDRPDVHMCAFLVTRWTGEPVNVAPEEHDDLRWFRPDDLADLTLAHPETLPTILSAVRTASG